MVMFTVNVTFLVGVAGLRLGVPTITRSAGPVPTLVAAAGGGRNEAGPGDAGEVGGTAGGTGIRGDATNGTFEVSPFTSLNCGSAMTHPRVVSFWITHQLLAALRPTICATSPVFIAPITLKFVPSPARILRFGAFTVSVGLAFGSLVGGAEVTMMNVGPAVAAV